MRTRFIDSTARSDRLVARGEKRQTQPGAPYTPAFVDAGPAAGVSVDSVEERSELVAPDRDAASQRSQFASERRGFQQRRALLLVGVLVVLAIPLAVALGALREPRWYPLLDMAQTELRVRDVASTHPPLIGLAGRIGPYGIGQGSHPGPLSFYALWPFYQGFGATAWALEGAAVALAIVAMGLALWIGHRRGGPVLLLAVAVVLAVLTHAYGPALLTQAWNPYLPVTWWIVFLLAVWSLLLDDLVMLPVAVFAGTFCMQTHISYLGLVAGLSVIAAVAVVVFAYRNWRDVRVRRALRVWGGVALVVGVVAWAPPVFDQFVHEPGNFKVIWDHFSDPPEAPIGIREGADVVLTQLNPWTLLTETLRTDSQPRGMGDSLLPGILLLTAWAGSVVLAWRLRHRALLMLHVVLAAALAIGVVSTARIFGFVWYYLLLWAWGLNALLVLAIGWAVCAWVGARLDAERAARSSRIGRVVLGGAVVLICAVFTIDAAKVDVPVPRTNHALGEIVTPTAKALERASASGQPGPYLITWLPDPISIGAQGFGMLNELDRRGFDVRANDAHRPGATRHRVIDPGDATVEIHIAVGRDIERWRADVQYEEITYFDPRTPKERVEFDRLRSQVVDELERERLSDAVPAVDDNLFVLGLDSRIPRGTRDRISRMLELGLPEAVFIGPPSGSA